MRENNVRLMSSASGASDVNVARDEPSHIHIARPSRLRRDHSGARVEQTAAELRELDPAAAQVTVQAA